MSNFNDFHVTKFYFLFSVRMLIFSCFFLSFPVLANPSLTFNERENITGDRLESNPPEDIILDSSNFHADISTVATDLLPEKFAQMEDLNKNSDSIPNLETNPIESTEFTPEKEINPISNKEEQPSETSNHNNPNGGSENLAQKSQNPIADLISVPFQNNINFNVGPFDDTQYVLNVQPVIPLKLNEDWLLVTRIIVPFINQPTVDFNPTTGTLDSGGTTLGLGDINPSFFFVPRTQSDITWGVGPALLLPTATDEVLGTEKWGIGPSAVIVAIKGKWLYGALANQIWSFAGDNDRQDVSQLLIQPFINYSLGQGWTIGSSPIITANWNAEDSSDKWTVPLGLNVSKLVMFGKQPVNLTIGGYYNVARTESAGDWNLRIQINLLFPS